MTVEPAVNASELARRLGPARVALRGDLRFYRHVFRGRPCYVARDPVSMNCHRFTAEDYQVLTMIDSRRSLADVFTALCERGVLTADDEQRFYDFIVSLHQLGFLNLPICDDRSLYRRFLARRQAMWKQRLAGFLFLQIPLINPDGFLTRTAHLAAFVFSRWFFALYLVLMSLAGAVAVGHWRELIAPAHDFFAVGNVGLMFIILILLKVIHEFGHAYACKLRGGTVPEMGAFLVVFAPLAYVDATSAWGFTRKRDRLIVSLAGMYVETFIAALAVLVWAATPSPTTKIIAHNVLTLAGLVTVVMNANPLMRFDGYYILSDLAEIPNLRQRAQRFVQDVLKRIFFNVPITSASQSMNLMALLLGYGVSAAVYKAVLVLSIAAVIATRAYFIGIAIAAFYILATLLRVTRSLTAYLWRSPQIAPYRMRAVALSTLLLAGFPAAILLAPVPSTVRASGQLARENQHRLRSTHDGFLESIEVRPGDFVDARSPVALVRNPSLDEALLEARGEHHAALLRARAWSETDRARALAEQHLADALQAEVDHRLALRDRQRLAPDTDGQVIDCLSDGDLGRFIARGQPLATIVSGAWQARALLSEDDLAAANPRIGQSVELRAADDPAKPLSAIVTAILPTGSRQVTLPALTQHGGGSIPVHTTANESLADRPYFEIVLTLDSAPDTALRHHATVSISFPGPREPIGNVIQRRFLRLIQKIQATY